MFEDHLEEDDQAQDLDAQLSWDELEQFLGRQIKVQLHQQLLCPVLQGCWAS